MSLISESFSAMCVWIVNPGSPFASAPSEASSSGVQEMAKRGVSTGLTSAVAWWLACDGGRGIGPAALQSAAIERIYAINLRVSATDCSADGST